MKCNHNPQCTPELLYVSYAVTIPVRTIFSSTMEDGSNRSQHLFHINHEMQSSTSMAAVWALGLH